VARGDAGGEERDHGAVGVSDQRHAIRLDAPLPEIQQRGHQVLGAVDEQARGQEDRDVVGVDRRLALALRAPVTPEIQVQHVEARPHQVG
jgi:hypothetical protein